MFSNKNTLHLSILNRFSDIENKIDTLNLQIETVKFIDGCCNCKKREKSIFIDIKSILESKLDQIKHDFLEKIEENKVSNDKNLLFNLQDFINITLNKNKEEMNEILSICYKETNHKTDKLNNKLDSLLSKEDVKTDLKQLNTSFISMDQNLRKDLQSVLYSVKSDICHDIKDMQKNLNKNIDNINDKISIVNKRVDDCYYDNEIIKHQILLEEDIHHYNDDIDNLKLLINNIKNDIDNTLSQNNYNDLKLKFM